MRTSSEIIAISLRHLGTEAMKRAKAEAKEIASRDNRSWMEVYYERNLADKSCHYEGNIPKDITSGEFDQMIDELDILFRSRLVGI